MNKDMEDQWIADTLDRIELHLAQIQRELSIMKGMLIFLAIVSPPGLYCIVMLTGSLWQLGVAGLWIAIVIVAGFLLLLLIARLTGTHKALRLNKDDLMRILKKHDHGGGTPT